MDILHTLPAGPQHASRTGRERRVNSPRQARHLGTPEAPLIVPRAQALRARAWPSGSHATPVPDVNP
jgi:hypothetical protein